MAYTGTHWGVDPALGNHIHVWWTDPEQVAAHPHALAACRQVLNTEERKRADRFHFERHRVQFTVAHGLLRWALSHYATVPDTETRADTPVAAPLPNAWSFADGKHGKPELVQDASPHVSFNLTHTDGAVACAIGPADVALGVDVEQQDRQTDPMSIAHRFFAQSELAWLQALPATERQRGFFRLWTLKEAYIKARGMGLALPLQGFAFAPDDTIRFDDTLIRDTPEHWRFWYQTLPAGVALAVGATRVLPGARMTSATATATTTAMTATALKSPPTDVYVHRWDGMLQQP